MKILIKEAKLKNMITKNKKILIVGYTFKENCSDIRNTKVSKLYDIALKYFKRVDIYDPVAYLGPNYDKKKFINLKYQKAKYSAYFCCWTIILKTWYPFFYKLYE